MSPSMFSILLSCVEVLAFAALLYLFGRAHLKKKIIAGEHNKLTEILSTAPHGYFYFLYQDGEKNGEVCSRKLAVLLGILTPQKGFKIVLSKLNPKGQERLKEAVKKLQSDGKEFCVKVKNTSETLRLSIIGMRASSEDGTVFADVLWFQDETKLSVHQETYEKQLKMFEVRDALFCQALDGLPFPLWMRNSDLSLAFSNQAYLKLAGGAASELKYESAEHMTPKLLAIAAKSSGEIKKEKASFVVEGKPVPMLINEVPLGAADDRYTLGFALNMESEENLRQTLQSYLKAQYDVLGALSSGIAIFNASGYLQFYNRAFCDVWKLDSDWLENGPSYSAILDRLREKRMLPEEADFISYKHAELELFGTLHQMQEDVLHLPTGQVLKRVMTPYPLGGVMMTFEDVTDRISLERSYNEQLAIQKSIINHLKRGMVVFDRDGRLGLYNKAYVDLFPDADGLLDQEPFLMTVLETQKSVLGGSEDVGQLMLEKILQQIEDETDEALTLSLPDGSNLLFASIHLPDGGLLLSYERA